MPLTLNHNPLQQLIDIPFPTPIIPELARQAYPAGLAYCLPMGTPAMAIVYGSGFLKSRDIIIPGALIMVLSWLLFLFSARFIWPLIGLNI